MTDDRQEKIRTRAHAIWQSEGEPHGRHDEHWAQAESEVGDDTGNYAEAVTPGSGDESTTPEQEAPAPVQDAIAADISAPAEPDTLAAKPAKPRK